MTTSGSPSQVQRVVVRSGAGPGASSASSESFVRVLALSLALAIFGGQEAIRGASNMTLSMMPASRAPR